MSMQPHTTDMFADTIAVGAGNDAEVEVGKVQEVGTTVTVSGVKYIPDGTITGAATNNRTLQLINKSQANAVIATLNFANGVNAPQGAEKDIPVTGNATPNVGDVLAWVSTHIGTGIADPGGKVRVTITRTTAAQ